MISSTISTAKDLISFLKEKLETIYEREEAENVSFMLAYHLEGVSKTDYVLAKPLAGVDLQRLENALYRLLLHEPIQHIIGSCEFYGLPMKVTPDVLIPRPETEELVHHIIQVYKGQKDLKIIDYCTGSGCIAIALAKFLDAEVVAVDISEKALVVAKKNAELNGVSIRFLQLDLLENDLRDKSQESRDKSQESRVKNQESRIKSQESRVKSQESRYGDDTFLTFNLQLSSTFNFLQPATFNCIVSNPPYVLESEKKSMNKNVLDYDPHLALFVDDADALIFYERITQLAAHQLEKDGKLFFEINEQFGKATQELMEKTGFGEVQIMKDFRGKDRMAVGTMKVV